MKNKIKEKLTQASHIYIQTNRWRKRPVSFINSYTLFLHRNSHFRRLLRSFSGETSPEAMAREWASADRHVGLLLQLLPRRRRLLPSLRRGLLRNHRFLAGVFLWPRFSPAFGGGGGIHSRIHRRRAQLRPRIWIPQQVSISLSRRFCQRRIGCMDSQGN